eukprot:1158468-Pleurochrysis_carterae.AAC.1
MHDERCAEIERAKQRRRAPAICWRRRVGVGARAADDLSVGVHARVRARALARARACVNVRERVWMRVRV